MQIMTVEEYVEVKDRFEQLRKRGVRVVISESPVTRKGDVESMAVLLLAPGFRTVVGLVRQTVKPEAEETP